MTIRRATHNEIAIIRSYGDKVRDEASLGYLANSPYAAEELKGFNDYFISEDKGVIQGWVLVGESFDYYTSQTTGMILELYVFKEHRNRGLGKILIKSALSYFKHLGLNRIHLNVFSGNHAKKLYEKLGFKEVSTVMEKKI
ncbi:GNAT family N-acetyltransferase [Litchfieldia salsa]|uniref:L-amino acid N-acyltransferase YncA n=1 Tax=Litchfieldia salsa TaxID=930152 RepID=A0A1H0WHI2_9BACI|nr:GNAT family N-acetyltransferase [Litchfieldia salsa]SDP90184.1 L-amino acid N-acyltransferase YncA [Litchfieldia salsa]